MWGSRRGRFTPGDPGPVEAGSPGHPPDEHLLFQVRWITMRVPSTRCTGRDGFAGLRW
jgi:hypothetical protein